MDGTASPRILVTRLSHIGDCILTLPMAARLRQAFPNAKIFWAVETPTQQLLSLHPALDELILIPKSWAGKPAAWPGLRSRLRKLRIDIAIDPQGITKSAGLGWLSGAPRRIGIRGRWGRELSPWLNNELVETQQPHIVDRSLELLQPLLSGDATAPNSPPVDTRLPICPTSLTTVNQWLAQQRLGFDFNPQRFVVINPGGSWASKRWEIARFGTVARYLKQTYDLTSVIVWAGSEEREMAQLVHDVAPHASLIADQTSLRELAALASQSTFCIAGDTGPLHIASASGASCIGLYGTTRPEDSGAYGDHHLAIQAWYQEGSCRERRRADNDAMRDIQVADVLSACDKMLDRIQQRAA